MVIEEGFDLTNATLTVAKEQAKRKLDEYTNGAIR
jgi:hypothetical protein